MGCLRKGRLAPRLRKEATARNLDSFGFMVLRIAVDALLGLGKALVASCAKPGFSLGKPALPRFSANFRGGLFSLGGM